MASTGILSEADLSFFLDHPETLKAKEKLDKSRQALFEIDIPESIQQTLQTEFKIKATRVPLRWFKGDTPEHADTGYGTVLVYLTDSEGEFIVSGKGYPIRKNTAFCFNQGVKHRAAGTGREPRLVLGPMDRQGNSVGLPTTIYYYSNEADAIAQNTNWIALGYTYTVGDIFTGSIGATTKWAVRFNGNIQPVQYTNGTSINYAPYINNSVYLFPASQSWTIPTILNTSPKMSNFVSDTSGIKMVTISNIDGQYSDWPFTSFDTNAPGIYISLDAGATWHLSYNTTYNPYKMACDATATNIYACDGSVLFLSNDGGNSWSTPTVDNLFSICCSQDGSIVYYGSGTPGHIYKSTDYGASFTDIVPTSTGLPAGILWTNICCSQDGSILYTSTYTGAAGIYKSTDGGSIWNLLTSAPYTGSFQYYLNDFKRSAIQCTPNGSIVTAAYLTNDGGFFHGVLIQSFDGGDSFSTALSSPFSYDYVHSLSTDNSGNYLVEFDNGNVYYNGTLFGKPDGIYGSIGVFLVPSTNAIFLGGDSYQTIFKTTNLGIDYTKIGLTINQWTGVSCSGTGDTIVAVTNNESITSGIFISKNRGATWVENTTYTDTVDAWQACAVNTSGNVMVVVGSDYGLIVTSFNGGITWTVGDVSAWWTGVATNSDGSIIYGCTYDDAIFVCTDGTGATWNPLTSGLPSIYMNWSSIACDSTGTKVIASVYNDNVYYSNDAGSTWNVMIVDPDPSHNTWQSVSSSASGQQLIACNSDNDTYGYVYISTDYGSTWTNGLVNLPLDSVAISKNGVVAFTGQDIVFGRTVLTTLTSNPTGWTDTSPSCPIGNWKALTSNSDGSFMVGVMYSGQLLILNNSVPCFLEGTMIETKEGQVEVEKLRPGDLVKTLLHGYLRIDTIGKRPIKHQAISERIKDQLYRYPESGLVVTGCHSVLVDNFVDEQQRKETQETLGNIYVTDNKYRLPACVDKRSEVYPEVGDYTVYHIALENDNYYYLYGIYANGMLVETCSKRYLKELSGMELIQ